MSKFTLTKKEMLDFNYDCDNAAAECPQYRSGYWAFSAYEIMNDEVKPKRLVKHWLDCDTLWKFGYSECLSEDTLAIIDSYKIAKIEKQLEKLKKKCS